MMRGLNQYIIYFVRYLIIFDNYYSINAKEINKLFVAPASFDVGVSFCVNVETPFSPLRYIKKKYQIVYLKGRYTRKLPFELITFCFSPV